MIGNIPYLAAVIIILVGLYAMVFKRNIIKMVIGLALIEAGVNLILIIAGYRNEAIAPIFTNAISTNMVLPTPQAMTLTNIVIGVAVTALLLSIAITIYRKYNTLDTNEIRRLRG
jgi:multicomponent Na+:H+ antiporter subunit C